MQVNRRTLIKQFLAISAGVVLIPSCMQDKSKASILLKTIIIDGDQEKMLAELAETIIPKTDTPGAKDISAHLFALQMIDDCYKEEEQQKFISGLKAFEEFSNKETGKSFVSSSAAEREALLTKLEAIKDGKEDLNYFYKSVKRLTIQAYTTSKYYLTNVQVYELVPGRFHGCVPVKPSSIKAS
jgi:hypothetical protein